MNSKAQFVAFQKWQVEHAEDQSGSSSEDSSDQKSPSSSPIKIPSKAVEKRTKKRKGTPVASPALSIASGSLFGSVSPGSSRKSTPDAVKRRKRILKEKPRLALSENFRNISMITKGHWLAINCKINKSDSTLIYTYI